MDKTFYSLLPCWRGKSVQFSYNSISSLLGKLIVYWLITIASCDHKLSLHRDEGPEFLDLSKLLLLHLSKTCNVSHGHLVSLSMYEVMDSLIYLFRLECEGHGETCVWVTSATLDIFFHWAGCCKEALIGIYDKCPQPFKILLY